MDSNEGMNDDLVFFSFFGYPKLLVESIPYLLVSSVLIDLDDITSYPF